MQTNKYASKKMTTALVECLTCECTPGKVFASASTLKRHRQTNRHLEFTKRSQEKDLRVRVAELEAENAKLRHDYRVVSSFLQNPERRRVTCRMKKEAAARAKWRCECCAMIVNANYEIDHVIPLYRGGDNRVQNLQCLCPDCHRSKTASDRALSPADGHL